jgi:hypothetical protein
VLQIVKRDYIIRPLYVFSNLKGPDFWWGKGRQIKEKRKPIKKDGFYVPFAVSL